jgi:hypothetical protein
MRLVRPLLIAVAVVAVGLAGFALGNRDEYAQSDDRTAATVVPTPTPTQAAPGDQATGSPQAPGGNQPGHNDTAGSPAPTTQPAPKPRIFGFGSEPVLPREGGFWQLPTGAGTLTLVTDAEHASKVEFLLTPTGTGVADLAVRIGQDTNGRDGYLVNWSYKDQPLLAHLTVRATGPGGTAEKVVGIAHPDPQEQP